MQQQTVRR